LEKEGLWESLVADWRNAVDFLQIQYWKAAARNREVGGQTSGRAQFKHLKRRNTA